MRKNEWKVNAPLLDDMVQPIDGLVLLQTLCTAPFPPSQCTGELLCERLVLSKLSKDGFVCEVRNVLRIVEIRRSRGAFIRLLPTTGFAGEYT